VIKGRFLNVGGRWAETGMIGCQMAARPGRSVTRTRSFRFGGVRPCSRDVKASRPMWPRGQIIRPRSHSFWPRLRSRPHGIWPRPHRNWLRGLEYLQRT